MHLALSVMFLFVSIFVCLGEHPARWAVMLAGTALLSLVRPEYAIALVGFVLYAAYLIAATHARDRSLLLHVAIGSILVALLYAHYGFPMYGGRSVFAFAQHFALNYSAWNHWAQDPWSSDYEQIFNSVFPHASSIFGALIANPSAFSHHLLSNLIHSPVMLEDCSSGISTSSFPASSSTPGPKRSCSWRHSPLSSFSIAHAVCLRLIRPCGPQVEGTWAMPRQSWPGTCVHCRRQSA